jgi:HEAT repeat protein
MYETSNVERVLGAIGTTFRLSRLYPPSHPAVVEAMRHVADAVPAVTADGTVEWKVGATGLHVLGQQLAPRNAQVSELAGLLFARGVRGLQVHAGVTPEHVLALIGVATGTLAPDDPSLGRITVLTSRRTTQRLSAHALSSATAAAAPPTQTPAEQVAPRRSAPVFRPDVLPADVETRRALTALREASTGEAQRVVLERIRTLAPDLLALRDLTVVAEAIVALDDALLTIRDAEAIEAIGTAAAALSEPRTVERMVQRVAEPHVPPQERATLVAAVGALASLSTPLVVEAFLVAAPDRREPYRAAMRAAADRALEPLQTRLEDARPEAVVTAVEFLGLTGSPQAVPLLVPLARHRADAVREAVLLALAELGGREIVRVAVPALKDDSVVVRLAAARAVGVAGDPATTEILTRRLEAEEDEGVQAELLRAVGRLGAPEALEILARYAEPGPLLKRRTPYVRSAAIEGLGMLSRPDARALLELYRQEKEPTVRRAAEAALK